MSRLLRVLPGIAAFAATACGGGAPAPSSPGASLDDAFVRRIAPFPVLDLDGNRHAHPFLGGFDVPRPQLVDIDGDGDRDLFVQERSGAVVFLENTGTPREPAFTWRSDRYAGLEVGEWHRFVDLDGDGDFDLLAEEPYSYIRHYRNEGTPQKARWVLAADSLRDVDGEPIFSDRQNIPAVVDLDADSRPDLFLGRVDGTITRYEAVEGSGAVPRFRFVTDRFEDIEIVGEMGMPGSGDPPGPPGPDGRGSLHGANSMAFSDWDGDGDPDLLWGDFFEPGLLFIENRGSRTRPDLRSEPVPLPEADSLRTSGYNAPVPTDIDSDDDLDLFVGVLGGAFDPNTTAAANFWFYERVGRAELALRTKRFLDGVDVGSESAPTLVDVDGDGDLDLLVGNKLEPSEPDRARLRLFENAGEAGMPELRLAGSVDAGVHYRLSAAAGDLDGDGDPDLIVGTWNDDLLLLRNEGTPVDPRFAPADSTFLRLTRGSNATPTLGDVDGDGDLDLFVGESSGTLNFYRNDGSPTRPRFTPVSDEFAGVDVGRRSHPALVDIDGDGDLDLAVGREDGKLTLLRNRGSRERPDFQPERTLEPGLHPLSAPSFGDLDGDGIPELVSGSAAGGLLYLERRSR